MVGAGFPVLACQAPEPRDFSSAGQRAAFLDWLKANWSYVPGIWRCELDLVDAPIVRVTSFVGAPAERVVGPDGLLVSVTRDYLIRVPPPDWWQPTNRPQIGI